MNKHTPGPWKSYRTLVYLSNNAGGFDLRNCPDGEANARLCAAAPDLLAALQSIVHDYDFCKGDIYGDRSFSYAETARDAIAKATGEPL